MKITIDRQRFTNAVTSVKDAVGSDQLAIIQNIKIETKGEDAIVLMATNTDLSVAVKLNCEIKEQGMTTIPARLFAPMLGALTSNSVTLTSDEKNIDRAVLVGGETKYKIATMDAAAFPLPTEVNGVEFTLSQGELKELLRKTVYAVSVDPTRRNLQGVCIRGGKDRIEAVGTDGYRMTRFSIKKEGVSDFSITIPTASVKFLMKILSGESDVVVRAESGKAARFVGGDWSFQTKLVDEVYPNTDKLFPNEFEMEVEVDRTQLIDAIRQVSVSTDITSFRASVSFIPGVMTLASKNQDISDAKVMIPVKYEGEEVDFNVNPRLLNDAITACDSDDITIATRGRMVVISCKDVDYKAVVMQLII